MDSVVKKYTQILEPNIVLIFWNHMKMLYVSKISSIINISTEKLLLASQKIFGHIRIE